MAVLIKGKDISAKIKEEIREEVSKLRTKPGLAVIIAGDDPASKVYVSKKEQAAQAVGMKSVIIRLPENVSQEELEKQVDLLNNDRSINGILVQLPLPKHIKADDIIQRILPEKDVDGFHPVNLGKLLMGLKPYSVACTPLGIIRFLEEYNIDMEGKNAVVIGRSIIVGKPLACLLLNKNATVTVCHSKTKNLKEIAKQADILIAAIGKAKFITKDYIKEGAVVIDAGTNRTGEGKLVGDVDFENVEPLTSYITPVPGGVGLMTVALLLKNTLDLYKIQNGD